MNLDWLKEYDWKRTLDGDYRIIADELGIENLIRLLKIFGKTNIYFSYEPLYRLREDYIRQNRNTEAHELARFLGVSERTIYTVRSESRKQVPVKKKQLL